MTFSSIRQSWYSRLINFCLIVTFMATMVITPRAQAGVMGLPQPGTMVDLSPAYVPLMVTGLTIHPENPLLMDFIVSTGNSGLKADQVKKESDRLIKYFLACLTIPENDQWVNLSPYEKDRIVPEDLGQTVLGQDMLAQDYLLKQLTASLIYPEKNLGKNFWDKVYAKASQMYGTTQIPVNTFNKVWILPDTAKVYEHKNTVFVVKSHLKVMLDEDYLALSKNVSNPSTVIASEAKQSFSTVIPAKAGIYSKNDINTLGSQIVREIVLPAIEQEVNTGKNFANMRQIYNSMILAVWFKKSLKQALLNQVYTDKSKVNGVNVDDPAIKEKIYKQYLQAYKKGVFNYIKEEVEQASQQVIPRKYFSGGLVAIHDVAMATSDEAMAALKGLPDKNQYFRVSGFTQEANGNQGNKIDQAMYSVPTIRQYLEAITIIQNNLSVNGNPIQPGIIKTYVSPISGLETQGVNLWEDTKGLDLKDFIGIFRQMFDIIEEMSMGLSFNVDVIRENGIIKQINMRFKDIQSNEDKSKLLVLARTVFDQLQTRYRNYLGDIVVSKEAQNESEIIEFAKKLNLKPADTAYVKSLFQRYQNASANQPLKIGVNFKPTASMDDNDWANYPEIDYGSKINGNETYANAAKRVVLLSQSMDGGLGSSLGDLTEYLKTITKGKRTTSGAKSSDLFKTIILEGYDKNGQKVKTVEEVSVLEIRLLQMLHMADNFGRIDLQELVSDKSKEFIEDFFAKEIYLYDRIDQRPGTPKRTYIQIIEENKQHAALKNMQVQALLPTIDIATKKLTDRVKAPGSHGYWGTTALYDIVNEALPQDNMIHMRTLSNGDGPNNTIDHYMAGYVREEGIGFVMLTSTRMPIDAKGGILGLQEGNGSWRPGMMELADAKNVGQTKDFQAAGLTKEDKGKQRFNTNVVIINDSLLQPFLQDLRSLVGETKFDEIIAPNLIFNTDQENGINKLEGALGHVLLNLNAWIMTNQSPEGDKARDLLKKHGIKRLFATINLEPDQRTKFFTPNKTASDQEFFNSDRFEFGENGVLINKGPDQQPGFELDPSVYGKKGKYIYTYRTFEGTSLKDFTGQLTIKGHVNIPNVILRGEAQITIINDTVNEGQPVMRDLNDFKYQLAQQGVTIEKESGRIVLDRNYTIKINGHDINVSSVDKASLTINKPIENSDQAGLAAPGGIDLNSRNLNMQSEGQKVNITFDAAMIAQFRRGDFSGVRIQILDVVPISLVPLLGLKEDEETGKLAKA